ncbi:MAG: PAS domain S-box protein [Gemmatimonadales bacterium]|nr:PAS domain S-box protein [Gemmatimonadales bacterium]
MSLPTDARERLAAVTRSALLDTPPEEAFDRLTRMAARLLGTPISLITLVTDDRQFFKSATGLAEPWASRRGSPLTHSFCRHVAVSGEPLVVEDARRHPLLRSNPALRELGWIAYAGVPLVTRQGDVVGAFSVVDGMPRLWSERDVTLLRDLAACAATEIELRILTAQEPSKPPATNGGPHCPDIFEDTGIPMGMASPEGRWTRINQALCELLGYREEELLGALAEGIIHPDDRPVQRQAVRLLLAGECPSYTSEHRCLRRSGEATWGLVTVTLVADAERRPRHFVFAIQDTSDRKRAEIELRESEERYRLVVQATRTAAWDWDLVTNRVTWGEGLDTLLGHAPPGLATSAAWWYQHIHAEDRERVVAGIQGALGRGERAWEQEYRFRRGDGAWARVAVRGYVVADRSGVPLRVVGAMADVTRAREVESELRSDIAERKRAESLAEGQSRLLERIAAGDALDGILDGMLRFAEEHGGGFAASLMLLEPGGEELRLVSAPSLPAEYAKAVQVVPVGPGQGSCGTAAYRRALVAVRDIATDPLWEGPAREAAIAAGLRACWSIPIFSTSGVVLGTYANYYRERRDPSPDDLRIVGIASHLAGIAIERTRNLEALASSTRLLQQVLETLPVGVWVVGSSGRIVYGNAAGQQLWGAERFVGIDGFDQFKGWWVESGRPIAPDEWAAVRALRRGEISLNELIRIEGFDGSERVILNSAVPITGAGGRIEGAIALNQDVSEQRAAEEALRRSEEQLRQAQKMEAVGQLAGGIAHDFNNLLTAILSYCDLLLEEVRQGDPIRGDIEQIRLAGQRAAGLTRQLLAFSRRQVLQPKVLSLNHVVAETNGMLRRLVGADIVLDVASDPGLWYALADPGQIELVLMNLVVNARDAMPQGGRLTIATSNRELSGDSGARPNGVRAGSYVALEVSDTGVGVDPANHARIFEPFFTTKDPGKGTGLGLSTVYGIVKQSGGHITLESAPGRGATFTVLLPRYLGNEPPASSRVDRRRLPGGTETLLLVEDEAAVRSSARRLLERQGYTVLEARHGADALRIVEESGRQIDLVVTDLVMPEMGGKELAERLRAHRPALKVLFMSGYTEKAIAADGVMPPNTGFLEKPFTVEQLMRRLREILDEEGSG